MNELKATRTTLKTRITTSATRLTKGIEKKSASKLIEDYNAELEAAYLDFIDVDVTYSQAVAEDEDLKDDFNVVNQLDCASYTAAVDEIHQKARRCYDQYHLDRTSNTVNELYGKMFNLWKKTEAEDDVECIERNLNKIEVMENQMLALKDMEVDYQSVEWDPLIERIEEALEISEGKVETAHKALKRLRMETLHPASSSGGSVPTSPLVTAPGASMGAPLMSTGIPSSVGTFPYTSSFDSLTAAMSSMST